MISLIRRIGERGRHTWSGARGIAAIVGTVCLMAAQPRFWPRTVRDVLARQVFFTAVEAVRSIAWIALLVGVSVVVQIQFWLTKFGQSALLGPLLVAIVVREIGPLLTNFVVIGRSGTAVTTELATMRVNGEDRVIDAQGIDPFAYLVLPRVTGMMLSVFSLNMVFMIVALASGYLIALALGILHTDPISFSDMIMREVTPPDVVNVFAKTIIPGALTGAICCAEGLGIRGASTEIPQAAGRAVLRSVFALFITSAVISVVTYL